VRRVKFTQSARKHRIGKAHALAAMNAAEPERMDAAGGDRLLWVAPDDRGVTLEVIGIDLPDYLLIIHVMPRTFRRIDDD
jgi:hypothetical protein